MKNILIVEDESMLAATIIAGLEKKFPSDFAVFYAENGQEALRLLESKKVHLVVTDLKMPVMDGFELLVHMKDTYPSIPVIVMSAYGTPEVKINLERSGCADFVAKPVSIDDLGHLINSRLRQDSARGIIQNISIAGFLQLIEMENKTCMVEVFHKHSKQYGYFYFLKGRLHDAQHDYLTGIDAAREIIGWEDVEIRFRDLPDDQVKDCINTQLMNLILSAMKDKDESENESEDESSATICFEPEEYQEHEAEAEIDGLIYGNPPPTHASPSKSTPKPDSQTTAAVKTKHRVQTATPPGKPSPPQKRAQDPEAVKPAKPSPKTVSQSKEPPMNVQKLKETLQIVQDDLGDGLIATDIWTVADSVSIAGIHINPKATVLINQFTTALGTALKDSDLPNLGKYFITDLVGNRLMIVIPLGDYRWSLIVDSTKIQLGLLLNIVIPKIVDAFEEAVVD